MSPAVMALAEQYQPQGELVLLVLAAGPPTLALIGCGGLMVVYQCILFATTAAEASCEENGAVRYPMHLWNSFVLFALIAFSIEIFSLRYSLIPFYQRVGQFEVLGCRVGFKAWLVFMMLLSFLNMLDFTTDSFFAATTITADQCPGRVLDGIWRQVVDQSIFGRVQVWVELRYLAFVFWLLIPLQKRRQEP